jgi:hypothetical protein
MPPMDCEELHGLVQVADPGPMIRRCLMVSTTCQLRNIIQDLIILKRIEFFASPFTPLGERRSEEWERQRFFSNLQTTLGNRLFLLILITRISPTLYNDWHKSLPFCSTMVCGRISIIPHKALISDLFHCIS